jgi:hypothetical protein
MKQTYLAIFCGALLAVTMRANAQPSGQMILSKNASGPITGTSLELTLNANAECDQTQGFLPDGSKLSSQSFSLNTDASGVGTFQGTAQIISSDGRTILQGQLRGTVGIGTHCGGNRACRLPGHLEGLFETSPSAYARFIARSTTDLKLPVMMLNFSADLNQQSASPLPLYQGRLDGLVPSSPAAAAKISITPDKTQYAVNDPITAIIVNSSEETIQSYDLRSYCSVVQLQMQIGNQWEDAGECPLNRPSLPVNILPGQRMEVPLPLTLGIPAPATGTYRLALTFRFLEGGLSINDSFLSFSQSFVIAPLPTANNVSIKTDRDSYAEGEIIAVKITNEGNQPVVTMDHNSYCSVLTAQKQQANQWVNVAPCLLMTPTHLVKLSPHEDWSVKLPPPEMAAKLAPGAYQLELMYWAMNESGQPVGNPTTVYSKTFTVASKE